MIYLRLYIFFFLPQLLFAQNDMEVRTDISDRWQAYQSETKKLRKVRQNENLKSIRLTLERAEMEGSDILIISPDQPLLILNGEAIDVVSDTLRIALDEFIVGNGSQQFDFSIYSKTGIRTLLLQTWLVKERSAPPDVYPVQERFLSSFSNNFIISSLLLFVFLAFLVNKFPKDSSDYSKIYRSLSFLNREEALLSSRPLGRNNLLFVTLNALLFGFVLTALSILIPREFAFYGFTPDSFLLNWLITSVIIFLLIILKYFLIGTFCNLFVLGEYRNIQFFNSLRFGLTVSMLGFIVLVFSYLTFRSEDLIVYTIVLNSVVILLVLRVLVLFLKLSNYSKHKNFHLIIYLCATEIIPFLLVYKLILG